MNGFYIAHFLAPTPDGTLGRENDGRLHVTLAPDFITTATSAEMIAALEQLVGSMQAVYSPAVYTDFFGPDCDIEVRGLEPTTDLLALHFRLSDQINDEGRGHYVNPAYTGFNYHPHITVHAGQPSLGELIVIDTLTLWQIQADGTRLALRTWQLKKAA